jgi:hypothetical protein
MVALVRRVVSVVVVVLSVVLVHAPRASNAVQAIIAIVFFMGSSLSDHLSRFDLFPHPERVPSLVFLLCFGSLTVGP